MSSHRVLDTNNGNEILLLNNWLNCIGRIKRILWCFALLLFTVMLVGNLYFIIGRYLRYDVTVLVAMNQATNRTFPAIAFCNMCPLRRTEDGELNLINVYVFYIFIPRTFRMVFAVKQFCGESEKNDGFKASIETLTAGALKSLESGSSHFWRFLCSISYFRDFAPTSCGAPPLEKKITIAIKVNNIYQYMARDFEQIINRVANKNCIRITWLKFKNVLDCTLDEYIQSSKSDLMRDDSMIQRGCIVESSNRREQGKVTWPKIQIVDFIEWCYGSISGLSNGRMLVWLSRPISESLYSWIVVSYPQEPNGGIAE